MPVVYEGQLSDLIEPKLAVDPPSPIFVDSSSIFSYELGLANINSDALEINVDLDGAEPFLDFDEETLTFSMKAGNGV